MTWPNFLCPNCRAVIDLEADVEEDDIDWSDDEDPEKDPEIRRAIEESLKHSNGPRTDGDGDAIHSLDVTEARITGNGALESAPPADSDATAGATSSSSLRGANGSGGRGTYEHGQGANDHIRTPRPQRSFKSAASSTLHTSSSQDREQTGERAEDAELAALVAGMNFTAPVRTPPPPPAETKSAAERLGASQAVAIPGAGAGHRAPANVNGDMSEGDSDDVEEGDVTVMTGHVNRASTPDALSPNSTQGPQEGRNGSVAEIGGPDCPMTPRNDAG